jgi:hypothetical protein
MTMADMVYRTDEILCTLYGSSRVINRRFHNDGKSPSSMTRGGGIIVSTAIAFPINSEVEASPPDAMMVVAILETDDGGGIIGMSRPPPAGENASSSPPPPASLVVVEE